MIARTSQMAISSRSHWTPIQPGVLLCTTGSPVIIRAAPPIDVGKVEQISYTHDTTVLDQTGQNAPNIIEYVIPAGAELQIGAIRVVMRQRVERGASQIKIHPRHELLFHGLSEIGIDVLPYARTRFARVVAPP